jgi:two-component system, cell cycle sensor histidine kinase and response regulator CckA
MPIIKAIRKPIGIKIFSVILFVVLLQGVSLHLMFSAHFKAELVAEKKVAVHGAIINLQDTLQYLAHRKENTQIQKTITSLGTSVDLNRALLFDDTNAVIASTRIELIGSNFDSLMQSQIRKEIKKYVSEAQKKLKSVLWQSFDGNALYAISPIVLGQLSNESIRSDKIGILFLHYDMQWVDNKSHQVLTSIFLPMMFLLTIAGLGLAAYFNLSISHRIKLLNDFTQRFSSGNYNERIQLTDNDEISDLGLAFNAMAQEVEEQHRELLAREQDLAITLNSIGDAVITTDAKGHITRMNPVAIKLTGWSLQEAQGRTIKDIFPIINATTRQSIQNPIDKVMSTGNTVYLSNHTTLIAKDGTEYQIADSAAPIRDQDDKIFGMVLIFNDVTEQYQLREARNESEERFRQFSENVNEVFWIGSVDWGTVYYVNPAYEKIWGQTPEDLYRNPHLWIEGIHPDDRDQVMNDIPQDINNMKEYIDFRKYRIQREDGQILWIKARAYPIRDNDGNVIRIAGIAEDITEQTDLEINLRRSQKMEALGKLTGGIAHDYNNMLGVVLGYAELLEDQLKDQPELAKYAHQIHHAGERGARLTSKLLSFSRQKASHVARINLNLSLQSQQHMLEKTLTVRIKLLLVLAEKLWPICVDESELEDIILNLSINAMHAIEGNGQLTIHTSNEQLDKMDVKALDIKSGDYVLLSISDTGCGMSESVKEKIFEPFFTTKGEHGTGLGLSQVYGFVRSSGGVIKVYSESGYGARFSLYFPRYIERKAKKLIQEESNAVDIKGTETILLVDDEPALLNLNCEILSQQGFNVISTESAKKALDILEHEAVDLLISDIIMPEMDGYQLAAIVKEKYPDIKIQLVSGFDDSHNMEVLDESLQMNLLYKPFNSKLLLQKIHELLNT